MSGIGSQITHFIYHVMAYSSLIYLLAPVIAIESALGAYIYTLAPWSLRNRLFVLLSASLVVYDTGLLMSATAVSPLSWVGFIVC